MNDFQKIYQQSIDGLPRISLDASTVLDEVNHRRRVEKRRRQVFSSALVTCSLLIVCGIGSVTTAGYLKNKIMTAEQGRASAGAEAGVYAGTDSGINAEMLEEAVPFEAPAGGEENRAAAADGQTDGDLLSNDVLQKNEMKQGCPEAAPAEESADKSFRQYDTIEAFRTHETAALALPDIPEGEVENVVIYASAYREEVSFYQRMKDGKVVQIQSVCYEDSESHGPDRVYGPGAVKEGEYTTQAGFIYRLVETAGETALDQGVHASVSAGNFEVYADFWGYTQEQVLDMLESMDLSVYCDR